MDPYVLALQLYLFNKACGGLPLRIAEQVVVTSVVNATCWTARTVGSGIWWLVSPTKKQELGNLADLSSEFEMITTEQIKELEKANIMQI
jgi:hypothetical protein